MAIQEFNPYLKPWKAAQPNNVAGKGQIEVPGQVDNIVWQTRAAPPTAYENALGDALEVAFTGGAETAEAVVESLNTQAFRCADGSAWTVATFEAEMARLGA
ncbi:MAG: recombinase-like helix-turn-helix domain-containing protein [Burkholderiales bacterium]